MLSEAVIDHFKTRKNRGKSGVLPAGWAFLKKSPKSFIWPLFGRHSSVI
jgi:hypothetical protein